MGRQGAEPLNSASSGAILEVVRGWGGGGGLLRVSVLWVGAGMRGGGGGGGGKRPDREVLKFRTKRKGQLKSPVSKSDDF